MYRQRRGSTGDARDFRERREQGGGRRWEGRESAGAQTEDDDQLTFRRRREPERRGRGGRARGGYSDQERHGFRRSSSSSLVHKRMAPTEDDDQLAFRGRRGHEGRGRGDSGWGGRGRGGRGWGGRARGGYLDQERHEFRRSSSSSLVHKRMAPTEDDDQLAFRGRRGHERRGRGDRGRGGRGRGGYLDSGRHRAGKRSTLFLVHELAGIEDVDKLALKMNSQLKAFKAFLSTDVMETDDTTITLEVVNKVLENDFLREAVLKVLQAVCASRFLDAHLLALIQSFPSLPEGEVVKHASLIQHLLSHVCQKLPSCASKGFLLLTVLTGISSVTEKLESSHPTLLESLKELLVECRRCMTMLHKPGEKPWRYRFRRGPNDDEEIPPDDFDLLPLFPSPRDMDWNEKIFLRANKEEGAFRDTNHYLDIQFRLLREDYIRPLRKGIKEYRQLTTFTGKRVTKVEDLRIYHDVKIIGIVCGVRVEHCIQFNMTSLKGVRWESSRRLIFGSLVCLSSNNFETFFCAIVTDRSIKNIQKGIIQICFETDLENIIDLPVNARFTMVETSAFFEAYRHVLEGLCGMKNSLPMSRYVVDCNPFIRPPQYLSSDGHMNLSALLKDGRKRSANSVTIVNSQTWPSLDETNLNPSQMKAVKTALSKELAIIQGPPGTGKTYVGLKIAKILLENKLVWMDSEDGKRPILVVCYTNHALDQFLEGILPFCQTGIVRVGGRSKSERLEEFNLRNINRRIDPELREQKDKLKGNLEKLKSDIERTLAKLDASEKVIISIKILKQFMLDVQFDSLTRQSVSPGAVGVNMLKWLSNGVLSGNELKEDKDPYHVIEKEVVSKIIKGESKLNEKDTRPNVVHDIPHAERAGLYRFWLDNVLEALQENITKAQAEGHDPQDAHALQELARVEILPDILLRQVMNIHFYNAITDRMRRHLQEQQYYTVRAWLGVSDASSQKMVLVSRKCGMLRSDDNLDLKTLNELPLTARHELYRQWLQKIKRLFSELAYQNQGALEVLFLAEQEILPDNILALVINPKLAAAIFNEMQQRYKQQSEYLIRLWLGIDSFCQNVFDLEKLLQELDSADQRTGFGSHLNVEEEAEAIQNERLLDFDNISRNALHAMITTTWSAVRCVMSELADPPLVGQRGKIQDKEEAKDEGFTSVYQKKNLKKKIMHLRSTLTPMSEEEARNCLDLWSPTFTTEKRMSLYLFWLQKYKMSLKEDLKDTAREYNTESQQLRELKFLIDLNILNKAEVIGMTTTGAARLRSVLNRVACPIIILEEAAEVLEAHVVATLHEKCQHLILIGDHQQLKPSPTVYELCLHYKLDLSLFERLINNQLHHTTLSVQHRMQPEISRLVRHVYPSLEDHETTLNRTHIHGMKENVFLFHHEMEEVSLETGSKSNRHEAELCVKLCRYLLQQDYPPSTITILAAYSGQVFTLGNIMKENEKEFQGVHVTSVDNYQGEENDIIILSLVRNNQEGSVGFLGTDNRVCVALSRARNGFYAFGNFRLLENRSRLWKNICQTAEENGQLGDVLVLQCENHPQNQIQVTTAKDFDKAPEGGCQLPCDARLDCGHTCTRTCHGYDQDHQKFRCKKKCERKLCNLGHPCPKKCHEVCDKNCMYQVEKTFPVCGHKCYVECFKTPDSKFCNTTCLEQLPCGHACHGKCWQCLEKKRHTEEGEEKTLHPSNTPLGDPPCSHPCDVILDCGHKCQGSCGQCWGGRVHVTCKAECGRALLGCGHKCLLPCGLVCLPCKLKCERKNCLHGMCQRSCGEPCQPCQEPCPFESCPHQKCRAPCHRPCKPCSKPCKEKLKCGHRCSSFCKERCACLICDERNFVPLGDAVVMPEAKLENLDETTKLLKLRCGHVFNVDHLDTHFEKACGSLSLGDPLRCPLDSCRSIVRGWDCWRYADMHKVRHDRLQDAKWELIRTSFLEKEVCRKLEESTVLMNSYKFWDQIKLPPLNESINVNEAFTLINQIKLTKVLIQSEGASILHRGKRDTADTDIIWKLLAEPKTLMTQQRLRELNLATRRIAYIAKFIHAKHISRSDEIMAKLDTCLETLRQDPKLQESVVAKVDKVLEEHNSSISSFRHRQIDIGILDAPADQHLCDIGKPAAQEKQVSSVAARVSPSMSTSMQQERQTAHTQQQGKPGTPVAKETGARKKNPHCRPSSSHQTSGKGSNQKERQTAHTQQQGKLGAPVAKETGAREKDPQFRPSSSGMKNAKGSRQKGPNAEGPATPGNQRKVTLSRARMAAKNFKMDPAAEATDHPFLLVSSAQSSSSLSSAQQGENMSALMTAVARAKSVASGLMNQTKRSSEA